MSAEPNYWSGEDYVVEFLGYRFGFSAQDFEQRVTAAAVKLGLLEGNELDEEETGDLVELAADGVIQEAGSAATLCATGSASRSSVTNRSSTGCASSSSAAPGSTTA
jgi:predicted nucleotidyltransferase